MCSRPFYLPPGALARYTPCWQLHAFPVTWFPCKCPSDDVSVRCLVTNGLKTWMSVSSLQANMPPNVPHKTIMRMMRQIMIMIFFCNTKYSSSLVIIVYVCVIMQEKQMDEPAVSDGRNEMTQITTVTSYVTNEPSKHIYYSSLVSVDIPSDYWKEWLV